MSPVMVRASTPRFYFNKWGRGGTGVILFMFKSEESFKNWFFPSTEGPGIELSFPTMERVVKRGGRISLVDFGMSLLLSALPMPVYRVGCCTAPLMPAQREAAPQHSECQCWDELPKAILQALPVTKHILHFGLLQCCHQR